MQRSVIDVLIPVYNAQSTVKSAIDSIQKQTIADIRIFAIDDGSTDDTARILASIAQLDSRVKIISQKNLGIVDALNEGLRHVSAPLIARHDADDLADPDRFEQQLRYMESHPDCVAVSSFARQIDSDGVPLGANAVFPPPDMANPFWIPSIEPYLLHPFLMVRRESMLAVGGYHYAHHAEDTDLYWRLQEIGRLHVLPRVMGSYRLGTQSIMSRSLLSGRISAIHSQLAAVAANRRRNGYGDLPFHKDTAERMADAYSSDKIFQIAVAGLTTSEAAYLRAAFAAKLLELSTYRPYLPDFDDSCFIEKALTDAAAASEATNRHSMRRLRAIVTASMLRTGHWSAARQLLDYRTLPQVALRLSIQLCARALPMTARRAIRSVRGRFHPLRPDN